MMNAGRLYSIASVFFGIVSIATSFIFFISFPAAVLAITFGIFAVKRYFRKSGTTAILLGIIGIIITIIVFANIISALNVDSLIAGKWKAESGEMMTFTDRGAYVWYPDANDLNEYSTGYYKLGTGVYKNGRKYTMGYTVILNQLTYTEKEGTFDIERSERWLIYTPGEEVLDGKSDSYEMMNLDNSKIIKITKEKTKLFGIFSI